MDIRERLRRAIEQSGMNMKQFSEASGIPYRTLQNYASGDRLPGAEALAAMAKIGVDIRWLLIGDVGAPSAQIDDIFKHGSSIIVESDIVRKILVEGAIMLTQIESEKFFRSKQQCMTALAIVESALKQYEFLFQYLVALQAALSDAGLSVEDIAKSAVDTFCSAVRRKAEEAPED